MLVLPCPWCGERAETEFGYGGEARRSYPRDPFALDDLEWARFLFYRDNVRGPHTERWVHTAGCRRWFTVVRDTATNQIWSVQS